jgi:hypothetical protein
MQSRLAFGTITLEQVDEQRARLAAEVAKAVAAQPRPLAPLLPRPVGRPKRERTTDEAVAAAAAAAAVPDSAAAAAADGAGAAEPAAKRGKYTNWFASPWIHDILREYARTSFSARAAVAALRRNAPDDRYARLHHSTVRGWFDDSGKLLPRFQTLLDGVGGAGSARRHGPPPALAAFPAVADEIKSTLRTLRQHGTPVTQRIIRWIVRGVLELRAPQLLDSFRISAGWITNWARTELQWSWRKSTTAASKLPLDWEAQGLQMAMRLAASIEMYDVHSSLVVNLDQTGVHLVPASFWTYNSAGSSSVAVVGAEDKRQITAVVASSLYGDMLPLQLIFQGRTERSHPPATASSKAARVHITHSPNHWSSVETMQQWVENVLVPYRERCVRQLELRADAAVILLLDVWAVHTSEEFRMYLRQKHPRIHLVFVPANCTSKLQVADVTLQRPFKAHIRELFNAWAALQIKEQIASGPDKLVGFADCFRMAKLKPLVLQWCIDSWQRLSDDKSFVAQGWYKCCSSLFNVNDPQKRKAALAAVARKELEPHDVPSGMEGDPRDSDGDEADYESNASASDEDDELDTSKTINFGERRSSRARAPLQRFGGGVNPLQIALTEDSEN